MTEPLSLDRSKSSDVYSQKTGEGILEGRKIKLLTAGWILCGIVGGPLLFGGVALASSAGLLCAYYAVPVAISVVGGCAMVPMAVSCLLFGRHLEYQALELRKNAWIAAPSTPPPKLPPLEPPPPYCSCS